MDYVTQLLRAFDLASANQREQILRGLVDRLSRDEAASLDRFSRWKSASFDMLTRLPTELQLCVLDRLDIRHVYLCTLVCRAWRALLLGATPIVNHLLSTWFPLCHDKGSGHENSLVLWRAVRSHHLRATGRFRSRLTLPLRRLVGGGFSSGRRECLRHGHTYEDLICSACPDRYACLQPSRDGRVDIIRRYAHGRLAWQPRAPTSPIVVHDLLTSEQRLFTHPRQTLVAGLNMYLVALGDRLVVGASGRTIIAWDIVSSARSEITLPDTATSCATQDDIVLVINRSGHIFVWEFPSRLHEIGASPVLPHPVRHHDPSPIMFHPAERRTFFVTCLRGCPPTLLCVSEYRPHGKGYALSRHFSHDLTQHIPLSYQASRDALPVMFLDIRDADARGTFQLLKTCFTTAGGLCQVQHVMFNALTTQFSVQLYEVPFLCLEAMTELSCSWEGQLHMSYTDDSPHPALVILEQSKTAHSTGGAPLVRLRAEGNIATGRNMKEVMGRLQETPSTAFWDVVWLGDVEKKSSTAQSIHGLGYALSFQGKPCTYPGAHQPYCASRLVDQVLPPDSSTHYPLNRADKVKQFQAYPDRCTASTIYADESFLIVITDWDTYTIFCVDPDEQDQTVEVFSGARATVHNDPDASSG